MSREKIRRKGKPFFTRKNWSAAESRAAGSRTAAVPGTERTGEPIPQWESAPVSAKRNRDNERTAVKPYKI